MVDEMKLESTMIHEIPRGRWSGSVASREVVCSSHPTVLDTETDRFIREELLEPSLVHARQIVEDVAAKGDVPRLAREILQDEAKLPEHSQELVRLLHKRQAAASSSGIFLTAVASQSGRRQLVIMKAEHEEGVRLEKVVSDNGAIEFAVQHLNELIVGRNTRVYKIAVLWLPTPEAPLQGQMIDRQVSGFARYFLDSYLECLLVQREEEMTQAFVNVVNQQLLNNLSFSAEKRARYATAAVAYVEKPDGIINVQEFMHQYLDPADRDPFEAALPPEVQVAAFRRDTALVRNQVGGIRLAIAEGVTLIASAAAMSDQTVQISETDGEAPTVTIRGSLGKFKLAKPPP